MKQLVAFALLTACTGASQPAAQSEPAKSPVSTASAVPKGAPATRVRDYPVEERPELQRYFERAGVSGTIAWLESGSAKIVCGDATRCKKRYLPASTFKIPNSIIGIETGVVSDPDAQLPRDDADRNYAVSEWNLEHSLRSGLRVSCVPCFQAIARRVGEERMSAWVEKLDYGNRDTSGGIDRFWLRGALRISAAEQLDFLSRLERGELPIEDRTRELVSDILTLDVTPDYVLRGKTGLTVPPEDPMLAGWFVGWVEIGERRVYFATIIDAHQPHVDLVPLRRALTERILREAGLLPERAAQ